MVYKWGVTLVLVFAPVIFLLGDWLISQYPYGNVVDTPIQLLKYLAVVLFIYALLIGVTTLVGTYSKQKCASIALAVALSSGLYGTVVFIPIIFHEYLFANAPNLTILEDHAVQQRTYNNQTGAHYPRDLSIATRSTFFISEFGLVDQDAIDFLPLYMHGWTDLGIPFKGTRFPFRIDRPLYELEPSELNSILLSLRIIPSTFALSLLFWTALLLFLSWVPSHLAILYTKPNPRCQNCRYQLIESQSVCPECGVKVVPRKRFFIGFIDTKN